MMELREKIARAVFRQHYGKSYDDKLEPREVDWACADDILAIPELDPTPLHQRVLAMLGGLRDDMTPEDVSAVQRFVDRFRPDPPLEQHGEK